MITLKETINPDGLDWILKNLETFVVKEERKKFKRYAERIKDGYSMVTYKYSHQKGRLYAEGALSIQGFSKSIRNILAKGLYHDIDMCNAHPTLLYQLCQKKGWETPELRHYIEHRDNVLKTTSKVTMLSIIYGNVKYLHTSYLQRFADEMRKIAILVHNDGKDKFSKLSIVLQNIENEILLKMVEFYGKERVGVLCFDGLLLYKTGEPLRLEECEGYITDWKIKLVEKEIS